jgi:hypothetical protein
MAMIESNDYGGSKFPSSFSPAVSREREIGKGCDAFQRISVSGMEEIKRLFLCAYSILPAGSSSTPVRVHLGLTELN